MIKLKALPLLAAVNASKRDILVWRRIPFECAPLVTHTADPLITAPVIYLCANYVNAAPSLQVTFLYSKFHMEAAGCIVAQVMNTGLHYSATLEADLQEVAAWYLRGSAKLPFLVWRDTPPQHFDTDLGEYPGGQPPFTCNPLIPALRAVDEEACQNSAAVTAGICWNHCLSTCSVVKSPCLQIPTSTHHA